MNMENETDSLFKKGLAEYRKAPPPHLWNEISGKVVPPAQPSVNGSHSFRKVFLWLLSSLLFVTGLLFIWLYLLKEFPVTPDTEIVTAAIENTTSESRTETVIVEAVNDRIFNNEQKEPLINSQDGENRITTLEKASGGNQIISKPLVEEKNQKTEYHKKPESDVESVTPGKPLEPEKLNNTGKQISSEEKKLIAGTEKSDELQTNAPDVLIPEKHETKNEVTEQENQEQNRQTEPDVTEPDFSKRSTEQQRRRMDFIHGIRYSIGLQAGIHFYNAVKPFPEKLQYGPEGGLMLKSHYKRYSLTTGFGMISFFHKNPWNASLLRTDTTGFYPYITGVNFMPVYNPVDSTITGYTASANTANKPVIDTTVVYTSGNNDYRITYLSVPVLAGFEILHYQKVSLSAQSGIIYNRMIFDHESPPLIPDKGELLELSKEAIMTNKHFWQYQAGINVRYEPNLNWYAEGSASFRKPIDRWYHNTDSNVKPSSWVIGAAVGLYL